jgi:hypothetical protein
MNAKEVQEVMYLQSRFADQYGKTGLVSITSDHIQVKLETLLQIANDYAIVLNTPRQSCGGHEISLNYCGVKFITWVDEEKFLTIPCMAFVRGGA